MSLFVGYRDCRQHCLNLSRPLLSPCRSSRSRSIHLITFCDQSNYIPPGAYIWGHISKGLISGGLITRGLIFHGFITGGLISGAYIWGFYLGFIFGGLLSRGLEVHTNNFLRLNLFYARGAGAHIFCK